MSYKSLLFCPDEKTARLVTQVLTELEFTVELSNDPFATVKKLIDEHFDALVVDCQNEQDASLLFKGARNSSLNHSSLSVAVVEGQAGVAKAFRIGANLVLTKPINIEQSKGTLRVARGLLRKSEAKAASSAAATAVQSASVPAMLPAKPFAHEAATSSAVSPAVLRPAIPAAPSPAAPFAALELEKDPTPAPESSEVALLESMPDPINGKSAPVSAPMWAPRSQGQAEPIAASTGGNAAAAAPALAKITEVKLAGASPMVTQEPIVPETGATEHFPVTSVPVPTFSSLETHASSSGAAKKFIKKVAVLLILGVASYMAWQKLQPLQYLHGSTPVQTLKQPVAMTEASPTAASAVQLPGEPENGVSGMVSATGPDPTAATASSTTATVPSASAHTPPDNIRVQELPMNPDQKISAAPKPIVVYTKPGSSVPQQVPQPTPPSLPLAAANNSNAALANIVLTEAPAPKPVPGSFRISQGVSQGLVVKKVAPVYSATALQLRKEGAIDLMATINKAGAVTRVRVLSGDLMLAELAVEAVRQWKYRPYLLNGEPVEIETQITVNFRLPH
jgi:periplasmic protein TonB